MLSPRILLRVLILLTICSAPVQAATTFYVDSIDGLDTADGLTPDTAWQTISRVNSESLLAGDSVLFLRGRMWRELLYIDEGGVPLAPITFGAYGTGDLPVINAADSLTGWDLEALGVWQAPWTTDPEVVYLVGTDGSLTLGDEKTSLAELNSPGDWYWNSADNRVYLRSNTDPDSAFQSVEVGRRDHCIRDLAVAGNIVIENLELRGADADWGGCIDFRWEGGPVTVRDCRILMNGTIGVMMLNDDVVLTDNDISYNVWGAVWVNENATGWIISGNEIGYNYSGLSFDGAGNLAERNHIHHSTFNGVYLEYGAVGNTIRWNDIHDSGQCDYDELLDGTQKFELYSSGGDNNLIAGNLIHHGSPNGGAGVYFDNGSVGNRIYNNVIYSFPEGPPGDPHGIGIVFENGFFTTENNIVKNNICSDCRCSVAFADDIGGDNLQGNIFDNNCYFLGDIGSVIAYAGITRTLAQWQAMVGSPDPNSIDLDPQFLVPGADYQLPFDSPCVDSGVDVGLAVDYAGNPVPRGAAPDMGAYEFQALTVSTGLDCQPSSGVLPFATQMVAALTNNYTGQIRRLAGQIHLTLGGGGYIANWRAGFTNVAAGGSYVSSWNQNIPALGALIGDNEFRLVAADVTPAPYNQPPYPPAGDTATSTCTVTGVAP